MTAGLAAVTGATGFVGRRLVPALTARGWRVRILARRPTSGEWGQPSPETVIGELADDGALTRLTEGADLVIHGAGLIKANGRRAFFETNEDGAARVARAARRAGAMRVVQISSLAAREPALSDYAASKRAGEEAARAVLGERLAVVRPPAIYGPGDRETLSLFQLAGRSPVLPTPAAPGARLALVHVDDAVAEILRCAEGPWTPGVIAIGGDRPGGYGWREIFATAAAAMGRTPMLAPIPGWTLRGAGAVAELIGAARGAATVFNRGKARELLHADWSVSAAEMAPGERAPCRNLRAGFDDTVAWYRRAGWLPPTGGRIAPD